MSLLKNENHDLYKICNLQEKILEIMQYVNILCRENHIEYYIYGGTALGAKRHGGFIPWDDDLDIIMTENNFKKFIEIFKKQTQKDFYLQIYGDQQNCIFAKVRANNTAFIEDSLKEKQMHHGIYIDIFTLQNAPNKSYLRWIQYGWAKYLSAQNYAYTNHKKRNCLIEVILTILRLFPRRFLTKIALNEVKKYNKHDTGFYSKFTEGCRYRDGFFKKEILGKPINITFEKLVLMGPEDIEMFLFITYGNWMNIPSNAEIEESIHSITWDTEKNYTYYLKNVNSFEDEIYL